MSTWPNRGCLRRPLRGGWNNESRTARREVKPSRSDSSQQASSKPGAIQSTPPKKSGLRARPYCPGTTCEDGLPDDGVSALACT